MLKEEGAMAMPTTLHLSKNTPFIIRHTRQLRHFAPQLWWGTACFLAPGCAKLSLKHSSHIADHSDVCVSIQIYFPKRNEHI